MNKKLTTSLVASLLLATSSNLYSQDLSKITVTSATKSEQSIKDVTSNIEVITKEEIEERHFTTVIEALNTVSGLSFTSNGGLGASTNLFVRGMSTNRVLVLIDGVRYQDPSNTSGANFAHLMINDIEQIEVIKGAQSGIWGADAAAGVINIITKKASKGFSSNVNLEVGSFNTKKYGTSLSYGEEKYDFKLNASRITSDGFTRQLTYGNNVDDHEKDGYENTTISLDTNYNIDDDSKINLNVKTIDAISEYDSSSADDTTMKSIVDTKIYSTKYSKVYNNHDINFKYELSRFKREEEGTTWGVVNFDGKTQNLELNDNYKYNGKDFIMFGAGLSKDNVDYVMHDNSTNQKDSESKYSYATNSNRFGNTVFTQSIRYDIYSNYKNRLTGKVGVKNDYSSDFSVSSNIGTAYNVPSIIHQLNPWGAANLNLQPEEIKSFDIGFNYKSLTMTYFKSKVDNLIAWSGGGFNNVAGESNFDGLELSYEKDILDDLLLNIDYTILSAKDGDGDRLSNRPSRCLKLGFDYYGIDKLHVNLNGEYVGDRYDGSNNTGNYTVWNSIINYDLNRKTNIYLKLDNIFDKYYQTDWGFATAPRSAYIGVNYKF